MKIMDCTLRDGANVVGNGFPADLTVIILKALTDNRVPIIEMGNARGIGAYEVSNSIAPLTDEEYLSLVQPFLPKAEIGMFLNAKRFRSKYVELAGKNGLQFLRVGADAGDYAISEDAVRCIKENGMKVYAAIIFIIDLRSTKLGIKGLDKKDCPNPWQVLKKGFYLAFPLLLLVFLLAVKGWSPIRSGFWAIVASIAVSYIRKDTRMSPKKLWEAFKKGAMDSLTVASTCIISGIVIGMLSLTSLGLKFSSILVSLANGSMIILLLLAALAGVILGMGMTTTSVYIVLAVLVAPALTDMGIAPLAAHLFVFYYGCLACITPPVASASFAAAGLTESNPFSLGFLAWKMGLSGYIIPFMFMYNPELLFEGSPVSIAKAFITALIGIYALSASLEGFMHRKLNMVLRVLLFAAALLLIDAGIMTDIVGLAIVIAVFLFDRRNLKNDQMKAVAT